MTNQQTCKYNFIVSKTRPLEILTAMFQYISRDLPWNRMELDFVPMPANNISLLQAMQGHVFFRARSEFHMDSPYIGIENSWNDYLNRRDKKVKKNLDYFERKLNREGTTRVVSVHDEVGLVREIDCALSIEQSSWKGDKGTAIANSQAESAFYHELATTMSAIGKFNLKFLELNGKRIAFDYCLTHNGHFNVLKTGYIPSYSKYSPGRILRKKILHELFDDKRYKIYDLLGAHESWKKEWCDTSQTLLHIYIYNYRPSAIFGYAIAFWLNRIKHSLRRYPRTFKAVKAIARRLRPR